jgi:hypothetical protein
MTKRTSHPTHDPATSPSTLADLPQTIEDTYETLENLAAMSFVLVDLLEAGGDVSSHYIRAYVRVLWDEAERGLKVCETAQRLIDESAE